MATNWPNSVQTFTNPTSGSSLNSPSHADQHATVNDTVEALQQYAGLVLVKSVSIGSGVSSVTVTDAFDARYDSNRIVIDIDQSGADGAFRLQLGSTTTGYYGGHYGYRWTGVAYSDIQNNGSQPSIGASGGGRGGFSVIDINDAHKTDLTAWRGNWTYRRISSGLGAFGFCGGIVDNSTSYTSFTLAVDSTTMTGGTIRVYGYNNG